MRVRKILSVGFAAVILTACSTISAQEDRSYVDGRSAADGNVAPFSGGVMVGDTLYLSGVLGLVDGEVPDDPADEARAVMDAVKAGVEAGGMTMDDIVVVQIFCSDVAHYAAFNGVYRTYFSREYPARAFIGSGDLLFGARFEVMATAAKRSD